MPDRPDLIYGYDGSFEGLLCCVFESYRKKEIPAGIRPPESTQLSLFPVTEIPTDSQKADRVLASIPHAMGYDALDLIRRAFLTCLEGKELLILRFLRMGYRIGPGVMNLLADDTVGALYKAVRALNNEAHLLNGFLRFSDFHGTLVARMEPENLVLPLIAPHFCDRFPEERFLICDLTHGMALAHQPGRTSIFPLDELELPEPDEDERSVRRLWRLFYRTIEIKERHNPRCRMGHMPKRYWNYMTEFQEEPDTAGGARSALPPGPGGKLCELPGPRD